MTYQLKKEHLTNWNAPKSDWDAHNINRKPTVNENNNRYSSEHSSDISVTPKITRTPTPTNGKDARPSSLIPTPLPPTPLPSTPVPKKPSHSLKYPYNELPENGIPLAVQYKNAKKDEENKKKNIRKAPPGTGALAPFPEAEPASMSKNYYPYWHYYKLKNPDWMMRHRQAPDGQLIPYESIDPSQYVPKPAETDTDTVTNPVVKPRGRRHQKSHRRNPDVAIVNKDSDKLSYETSENPSLSLPSISAETYKEQRPSSKTNTVLKHTNPTEHIDYSNGYNSSRQRYQSRTTDTSIYETKGLDNPTTNQSKRHHRHRHHNHRHHHHHHHHQRHHRHHVSSRSQENNQEKSTIKSQEEHRHHHHHHPHHIEPGSSLTEYVDQQFKVVDDSFKKSERPAYFQGKENVSLIKQSALQNESSYLPPIIIPRDNLSGSRLTDFYSNTTLSKDWRDSIKSPRVYKADPQTKFYDRYLNSVIEKKLVS